MLPSKSKESIKQCVFYSVIEVSRRDDKGKRPLLHAFSIYISYSPVAMIKHYGPKAICFYKGISWDSGSGEIESILAEKAWHGSRCRRAGWLFHVHTGAKKEQKVGPGCKPLKPTTIMALLNKTSSPEHSLTIPTAPPTGNQGFQYRSLWGIFLMQTTTVRSQGSRNQGLEIAAHIRPTLRKQKAANACCSAPFPNYTVQNPSQGMVPPMVYTASRQWGKAIYSQSLYPKPALPTATFTS